MTNLEADRRLEWKTYWLIYELLDEIFLQSQLPDLILLDMPLIMGRDVYAQSLADQDPEMDKELKGEIEKLQGPGGELLVAPAGAMFSIC